jgi:hypothetical protein
LFLSWWCCLCFDGGGSDGHIHFHRLAYLGHPHGGNGMVVIMVISVVMITLIILFILVVVVSL